MQEPEDVTSLDQEMRDIVDLTLADSMEAMALDKDDERAILETLNRVATNDPTLVELKFYLNQLEYLLIQIFCEKLKTNDYVKVVDFSFCNIGDAGAELVVNMMHKNRSIHHLILQGNTISDRGADKIAEMLAVNSTLYKLDLDYNQIGNKGIAVIVEAIKLNETLVNLRLGSNLFDDEHIKLLSDAIASNASSVLCFPENLGILCNRNFSIEITCLAHRRKILVNYALTKLRAIEFDSNLDENNIEQAEKILIKYIQIKTVFANDNKLKLVDNRYCSNIATVANSEQLLRAPGGQNRGMLFSTPRALQPHVHSEPNIHNTRQNNRMICPSWQHAQRQANSYPNISNNIPEPDNAKADQTNSRKYQWHNYNNGTKWHVATPESFK